MADRSLAIRLAVIDGGKVKAELRDVGDAGSRSLKRIENAARPVSRALQALDGVAGEVRGGLEAMSGRLGPLGAGLSRLGPAGVAAAEFSDGIERSTLSTAEAVQDAASILATFRSVAGETFTRTLSLAQDMAAVFGQDLSSSATQLGDHRSDALHPVFTIFLRLSPPSGV